MQTYSLPRLGSSAPNEAHLNYSLIHYYSRRFFFFVRWAYGNISACTTIGTDITRRSRGENSNVRVSDFEDAEFSYYFRESELRYKSHGKSVCSGEVKKNEESYNTPTPQRPVWCSTYCSLRMQNISFLTKLCCEYNIHSWWFHSVLQKKKNNQRLPSLWSWSV